MEGQGSYEVLITFSSEFHSYIAINFSMFFVEQDLPSGYNTRPCCFICIKLKYQEPLDHCD